MSEFDDDELLRAARLGRALLDRLLGDVQSRTSEDNLLTRLTDHLGTDPSTLPVVTEQWAPHEHADVQLALERWLDQSQLPFEIVGTPHPARRHQTLPELLQFAHNDRNFIVGPPDWVHVPVSPDDTHPCVAFGIYLVGGPQPLAMMLRGPDPRSGMDAVQLELLTPDPDASGALMAQLRRLAIELSPVRGQIVTLAPPDRPGGNPITFLRRPHLDRGHLVLPEETLDALERHVVDIAALRPQLQASGQHLKRGVLLYGPPGTGKTHSVRYLLGRLDDVTAVVLSGMAVQHVGIACSLARRYQPSVVVLEDIDLIAGDRSFGPPGSNPLLFEVLNQLDGLGEDADVVFLLTTNRVEVLERALAERPGRVDEAVEIGAPDAAGRERLLRLYGETVGIAGLDLTGAVNSTEGLTATFLRELVRRAVILAAQGRPDEEPIRLRQEDLATAVERLLSSQQQLTQALLGARRGIAEPPGPYAVHGFAAVPGVTFRGRRARGPAPVDEQAPVPPGWEDDS